MKLYGAEFIKTPGGETDALTSLRYALKLSKENPEKYYVFDQWSDDYNVKAHYETTGLEIVKQLGRVDIFVAHVGTGGTLIGIGKRLKEENPETKVYGAEPTECPVATRWFQGEKNVRCNRHRIEGVGDGFIPDIIVRNRDVIDNFITVSSTEAIKTARELAELEGLAVGISSGANVAAAMKIIRQHDIKPGSKVVTVLPDSSLKYYSTKLFEEDIK
jgi:cysteine synthase A